MIVVYATYRACGAKADFSVESILKEYGPYGRKLKRSMGDVSALVSRKFTTHRFLFEQGLR